MELLIVLNGQGTHADVLAADDPQAGSPGRVLRPGETYLGIPYDSWHASLGETASLSELRNRAAPEPEWALTAPISSSEAPAAAPPTPAPDIAISDVLDTAFQLIRRGSLPVLGAAVLLFVPPFVVAAAPVGRLYALWMGLYMVASATWTGLTQVVLIHALSQAYEGGRPDLRYTLSVVAQRAGSVLGVTFMVGVAVLLGMMAFVLPGIFLMCMFYVAPAVVVLEDTQAGPALGRSARLVAGAGWKVLGAVVTVMLIGYLVRTGVTSLYRAGGLLASLATPVGFAANAFLTLLTAAVATSFYYALRVAREGYDLERMANRLEDDEAPALVSV